MPRPRPEALLEGGRWRLVLAREARGGLAGERLGRGTGASLEFQDRRAYVAGDDVRHVDWRAYGRNDQLLVRQYREEILPRVELLVDASRSMGVGADKAQATVDLACLLAEAAGAAGAEVVLTRLGDRPERVEPERLRAEGLELDGRRPFPEVLGQARGAWQRGGLRVLLSDLLAPHDPLALARQLSEGAGGVALVQLLGRADREPEGGEAARLEDAESGGTLDLWLDAAAIARYRERLARLGASAEAALIAVGGRFARLEAEHEPSDLARAFLAPAGLLEPRAAGN